MNNQNPLEQKIYTLLGFAQKAGKLVSGDESVFLSLNKKSCKMVIVATDLSDNSRKKFEQKLFSANENRKTALEAVHIFGTKVNLGHAIGKSPRGLIAVMDDNFANAITKNLKELMQ